MFLSDFQKKIIVQLIDKNIWDINSFCLKNFRDINSESNDKGVENFYYCIIEYLKLIEDLKKENLITQIEIYKNRDGETYYTNESKLAHNYDVPDYINSRKDALLKEINLILIQNIKFDIFSTRALEIFVSNGYKTESELFQEKAIKKPTKISYITITISLVALLFSFITFIINNNISEKEFLLKIEPKVEIQPLYDSLKFGVYGVKIFNKGVGEVNDVKIKISYDYFHIGEKITFLNDSRNNDLPYDLNFLNVSKKISNNNYVNFRFDTLTFIIIENQRSNYSKNFKSLGPEEYFIALIKCEIKFSRVPDLKEYTKRIYLIGAKSIIPKRDQTCDTGLCLYTTWNLMPYNIYWQRIKNWYNFED